MAEVIIFGVRDFAQLAHFYLTTDTEHHVAGFTVNREYLPTDEKAFGLQVFPFEDLRATCPPENFALFAPMSHLRMNKLRASIYQEGKSSGYQFVSYVSSHATVFQPERIGDNCFILEDNTIQPFVTIGNNVVIWSGNHIGHHSVIADHVFFTSHVVLSGHCKVDQYSFFGVNATIRDGIHIAEGTLVGMSACVIQDTDPWGVYTGVPAKKGPRLSKDMDI